MADDINRLIALELEWKQDVSGVWRDPAGVIWQDPHRYDTDWAATGMLLEDCSECETVRYGPCIWGATITLMDQRVGEGKFQNTLTAAIAVSWLAAKEAGRE